MLFAHLFFLQNFSQNYAFQLNGVYWTLPTEFGFYLILPLLAWLAYRMRRDDSRSWVVLGAGMVVFGICWRAIVFLGVSDSPIGTRVFKMLQLPGLVDQFGIGILFAWCYVRSRQIEQPLNARNSDALTILGLLGTLLVMVSFELVFEQY